MQATLRTRNFSGMYLKHITGEETPAVLKNCIKSQTIKWNIFSHISYLYECFKILFCFSNLWKFEPLRLLRRIRNWKTAQDDDNQLLKRRYFNKIQQVRNVALRKNSRPIDLC
jgi:hypothetical protein